MAPDEPPAEDHLDPPPRTPGEAQDRRLAAAVAATRAGIINTRVNLTKKSVDAAEEAARLTGDTLTDTINRSLQVYLMVVRAAHEDGPPVTGIRDLGEFDLYLTRFQRR